MIHEPVSASRVIAASPAAVFDVLADPRRHPDIDGSGMVRSTVEGPSRLGPGDRFSVNMKRGGVPWRMTSTVIDFETDRVLAWQAWLRVGGVRLGGGATWRYELRPTATGVEVTETYDVTTARGSHLFSLLGFPAMMQRAMTDSLARLEAAAGAQPAGRI
jgi:uncharacterized protein YndB with AHSA1/START domain